jgi:hypothetical protein
MMMLRAVVRGREEDVEGGMMSCTITWMTRGPPMRLGTPDSSETQKEKRRLPRIGQRLKGTEERELNRYRCRH